MRRLAAGGLLAALAMAACAAASAAETERSVTIRIRYTHFAPAAVVIPAGVPVAVTLRNDDPIAHEWIVGPPGVHAAHRTGTEASHDGRANEVTVPPFAVRTTTLTLDPGTYAFVCHLPGHEAYGMTGTLTARPAR